MLSATTRKICWVTLSSLFDFSSPEEVHHFPSLGDQSDGEETIKRCQKNLQHQLHDKATLSRNRFLSNSASETENVMLNLEMKKSVIEKCCCNNSHSKYHPGHIVQQGDGHGQTRGTRGDSKAKYLENGQIVFEKMSPGCFQCSSKGKEEERYLNKRVFSFQDAPSYLRFNPFITGGYRSSISPRECVKSLFWWTNETINIWTHLIGWFFFLCLSIYDAFGLLDLPTTHPWDQIVITLLLVSFQACMLLSSLYHIFCCHSEKFYRRWLSADLLGVSLSLLAIYISGIYYAFSCVPFWLNFYLVTVGAIFATAMGMQILPMLSKKDMVTEENFHLRLVIFGGWAAYGVVPTFHWALLHGGMSSPVVALLLPRIVWMYLVSGAAFIFFVMRIPERLWPGLVNYVGSSHQLWHILIVAALYHWHNTGMLYLQFRSTHPCSEEYAYLFPTRQLSE